MVWPTPLLKAFSDGLRKAEQRFASGNVGRDACGHHHHVWPFEGVLFKGF
jgi:hypothetical protein